MLAASDAPELTTLGDSLRKFAESLRVTPARGIEFRRNDFTSMAELGLTGMAVDERCGGTAMSQFASALAIFELARAQLGPAIYLSVHLMVARLLQRHANNELHFEALRQLADGRSLGAFALSEAEAGSDAASLRTKAERTKDRYILSGEKLYITSGNVADIYLVFARTGAPGAEGITAFLVKRDTPGLSFGRPEKKMGCEGAPITAVHLENCALPPEARLGAESEGYSIALSGLNGGRANIAAAACGLSARALEICCAHVKQRSQFGKQLSEFQGLQFMLSDMAIQLRAALLLTRDAAQELDRGGADNFPSSVAKCFATDAAMEITTNAVQVLGGAGYLEEYEVERLMRDAKMLQIVEGTNQIQRIVIARELLRG